MSILVTFADGHSTLVVDRAAADQIVAYWPQLKATIRDLDQEAKDREDMIGLLAEAMWQGEYAENGDALRCCVICQGEGFEHNAGCRLAALLKRLGRLP